MKLRMVALAMAWCVTPVALQAQSAATEESQRADQSQQTEYTPASLREKLMPAGAGLRVTAPSATENPLEEVPVITHLAVARASAKPLMIVGGALFVAGLLAGGDGGTLLIVAGAGIGAYGLYLHLQ